MARIASSFGHNQRDCGRVIDSDDELDQLGDGTMLSNLGARASKSVKEEAARID